jgi:hypothetical protein
MEGWQWRAAEGHGAKPGSGAYARGLSVQLCIMMPAQDLEPGAMYVILVAEGSDRGASQTHALTVCIRRCHMNLGMTPHVYRLR